MPFCRIAVAFFVGALYPSFVSGGGALNLHVYDNGESNQNKSRTVALTDRDCRSTTDLSKLVFQKLGGGESPMVLYNDQGVRVYCCDDLSVSAGKDGVAAASAWAVPTDRLFIWPTFGIGHTVTVRDVLSPVAGKAITLETISREPKIFRLLNFFSEEESVELIKTALAATEEQYRLKRSSTGASGYNPDSFRTSENAFDTSSEVAMRLKRRAFDLLGVFPYNETYADGLQVLRYNQTTAYIDHMDWIDPNEGSGHNFDSSRASGGTNRFATILLYLSDVEDGGETSFANAEPEALTHYRARHGIASPRAATIGAANAASDEEKSVADAYLSENGLDELFPPASWQRDLIAKCRSRLAIKPKRAEAILFYSQDPTGAPDRLSQHAGCPVLKGDKWAANLWVWNGPRHGYWRPHLTIPNAQVLVKIGDGTTRVTAVFRAAADGAKLFWENVFWADLVPEAELAVDTYVGHRWHVRRDGREVASWVVAATKALQRFTV